MPAKPSQIPKPADSLGIWHKASIAIRRPSSGRRAYFGSGLRNDLCTKLAWRSSRALQPNATLLVSRELLGETGRQGERASTVENTPAEKKVEERERPSHDTTRASAPRYAGEGRGTTPHSRAAPRPCGY